MCLCVYAHVYVCTCVCVCVCVCVCQHTAYIRCDKYFNERIAWCTDRDQSDEQDILHHMVKPSSDTTPKIML